MKKRTLSKLNIQRLNRNKMSKCNLCFKRDVQPREEQMKLFKHVQLKPNVGIYRVSSSHRTPKDTAHKQVIDQYTSIVDVVKTLKEGNNAWPEPTWPLQRIC